MVRTVGAELIADKDTLVTAGTPETLETLAAIGTPTAVVTAATAEFLATARILGTSTAVRTERVVGPTAATRDNWIIDYRNFYRKCPAIVFLLCLNESNYIAAPVCGCY
jgi:hypothetical protein